MFLREEHPDLPGYKAGWNTRYTTELTRQSWFYLRGEEYSNQMDDFITAAATGAACEVTNDFRSAAMTDDTIADVLAGGAGAITRAAPPPPKSGGWLSRVGLKG